MQTDHLVLTLFSCRFGDAMEGVGKGQAAPPNPMSSVRLEVRFSVFETVTAPSLLAQDNQDFGWIIIIDRALDAGRRERLRKIVAGKERVHLHEYDPAQAIERIEWLQPYIRGSPDYLVTTNLDDDDALPTDYFSVLRRHFSEAVGRGAMPPVKVVGTSRILEWDMVYSTEAPLGRTANWHRGKKMIASAGVSLLARYPECPIQVTGISHAAARAYFDLESPVTHAGLTVVREHFATAFEACGEAPGSWSTDDTFSDLTGAVGPVLVTNHRFNNQRGRLLERKANSVVVTGPETFPGIAIAWDQAGSCVRNVSESWPVRGVRSMVYSVLGKLRG